MLMRLRTSDGGGIFGERDLADGVTLHFAKWENSGHKSLYITTAEDVVKNIADYSVTDDKGVISGVYKDGYHFDELIDINKDALRYEVDGDNLILYYPMARILKTIRKKGVTYSKKIILEENN